MALLPIPRLTQDERHTAAPAQGVLELHAQRTQRRFSTAQDRHQDAADLTIAGMPPYRANAAFVAAVSSSTRQRTILLFLNVKW
jgi:hypothetical protein